jgi:hypothetical protein
MDWLSVQRLNVMPITRMICFSVLAYLLLDGMVTAQSGLNSTESTSIAGSTSTDTLWADSTVFRWMMDNHNTFPSGQLVAAWPCTSTTPDSTGCIPYAAAANAQGVYVEQELPLGAQGSILQAGTEPSTAVGPVWTTYTFPMGTMCLSGYFLASNGTNFICNSTVSSANNPLI